MLGLQYVEGLFLGICFQAFLFVVVGFGSDLIHGFGWQVIVPKSVS